MHCEAALSVLSEKKSPKRILELGTGSGAIVVALASERPNDLFFASDRSLPAVQLARKNARQNGLADGFSFSAATGCQPCPPAALLLT